MTVWRPSQNIRVKALGLHWRDGHLLAMEVEDDDGNIKGVRPLGGGVEFGETWQRALKREFKEELDVVVTVSGPPIVIENIYEHHGVPGHEIIFVAEVTFPSEAFHGQGVIHFSEDDGTKCAARWFDLHQLDSNGSRLYPEGLKDILLGRTKLGNGYSAHFAPEY